MTQTQAKTEGQKDKDALQTVNNLIWFYNQKLEIVDMRLGDKFKRFVRDLEHIKQKLEGNSENRTDSQSR